MSVTISTEILGNKEATDWYVTETITLTGKVERELYNVTSSDSWISIPITKLGVISKIIATSTSAKIRITYTDSGSQTIIIPIDGIFIWSTLSSFSSTITAIDVSTSSTSNIDITIAIYGEAA